MHRSVDACVLQCRSLPPSPGVAAIIPRLCPFRFRWHHAPDLDVDCVISLGDAASAPMEDWHLQVRTDDADFATSIAEAFGSLGCALAERKVVPFIAAPQIRYGSAPAFVRAVLASVVLKLCGEVPQQAKVFDDDDDKICLDLPRTGTRAGLRERLPIQVRIDDPAAFAAIQPRLAEEGFGRIELHHVVPDGATRLSLDPGALSELDAHVEVAAITRALAGAARELGVDLSRYPLQVRDPASDGAAVVTIPAAAMRTGALRPWSRLHPEGFPVTIRDDDRRAGSALKRALEWAGIRGRTPPSRQDHGRVCRPLRPRCAGARAGYSTELVDAELLELGAHEFGLSGQSAEGDRLEIEWPARAFREGRLLAELAQPKPLRAEDLRPECSGDQADRGRAGPARLPLAVHRSHAAGWGRRGAAIRRRAVSVAYAHRSSPGRSLAGPFAHPQQGLADDGPRYLRFVCRRRWPRRLRSPKPS